MSSSFVELGLIAGITAIAAVFLGWRIIKAALGKRPVCSCCQGERESVKKTRPLCPHRAEADSSK